MVCQGRGAGGLPGEGAGGLSGGGGWWSTRGRGLVVYQGEGAGGLSGGGAGGLSGEGAGGLSGGGGWWSLRGRGPVVYQGEGGSEGGVFRDWSRRLLGRRLDLAPYFQPGFGFPRGLRQRMTGDHYAQQHRQALSEHADQAMLRPGPPPPRHSGWCLPVRRHRGTRAGVSRSAATAACRWRSPSPTHHDGAVAPSLRRPAYGGRWYRPDRRLGDRRGGELRLVGLPVHRQHVPRRHRQHQPQPPHSIRHRHPRRLPLPAAAFSSL